MLQGTENFWGKDFALQIMSVGSFVDDKSCEDAFFQVEAEGPLCYWSGK